jgi:hypothetical protein
MISQVFDLFASIFVVATPRPWKVLGYQLNL